jgi:hypothetical protein
LPLGILVIGANHFIVEGPEPDAAQAAALARQWSIIRIGNPDPPIPGWTIVTKAFRENLEWALVVESPDHHSPAVVQLLAELAARGIQVTHSK